MILCQKMHLNSKFPSIEIEKIHVTMVIVILASNQDHKEQSEKNTN